VKRVAYTLALAGASLALVAAAPAKKPKLERVDVAGVITTADRDFVVVLKTQKEPHRFLPIWIGEIEALNIQMRLERQAPTRPLTLHLLEAVLKTGNIELTSIEIDALKNRVFLGRLHLKRRGRTWSIDSRPSDAIGLAVGRGAPIFVSQRVLAEAALDGDLPEPEPAPVPPPPPKRPDAATSYEETL